MVVWHPLGMNNMVRFIVLAVAIMSLVGGCAKRADPLDAVVAQAGAKGAPATAALLRAGYASGSYTFWDAKDRAHLMLDDGHPDAAYFASAVLASGLVASDQLDRRSVNEFAWWSVGRLAYRAAEHYLVAGQVDGAEALMLAGPEQWKRESYWRQYPDHDALIAIVKAERGDRAGAIRWLEQRPVLMPPADEVYQRLTGRAP